MPGKLVETGQILVPTGEILRLNYQGLIIKGTVTGIEVRYKTVSAGGSREYKIVLDVGNQEFPEGLVVRLNERSPFQHIVPVRDEIGLLRRLVGQR